LLVSGPPVLSGEGRVTWVKEFNPAEPHRPHGMGVQFTMIDPSCRPVLDRLLRKREESQRRPTTTTAAAPAPQPRPASDARVTVPMAAVGDIDDIEDTALRRLVDRARTLSARTDDVEELLKPDAADEPATLSQALEGMSRYLRRAGSG